MEEEQTQFYGQAENPDTGIDTIWYTEDFCINIYYEDGE